MKYTAILKVSPLRLTLKPTRGDKVFLATLVSAFAAVAFLVIWFGGQARIRMTESKYKLAMLVLNAASKDEVGRVLGPSKSSRPTVHGSLLAYSYAVTWGDVWWIYVRYDKAGHVYAIRGESQDFIAPGHVWEDD